MRFEPIVAMVRYVLEPSWGSIIVGPAESTHLYMRCLDSFAEEMYRIILRKI